MAGVKLGVRVAEPSFYVSVYASPNGYVVHDCYHGLLYFVETWRMGESVVQALLGPGTRAAYTAA